MTSTGSTHLYSKPAFTFTCKMRFECAHCVDVIKLQNDSAMANLTVCSATGYPYDFKAIMHRGISFKLIAHSGRRTHAGEAENSCQFSKVENNKVDYSFYR